MFQRILSVLLVCAFSCASFAADPIDTIARYSKATIATKDGKTITIMFITGTDGKTAIILPDLVVYELTRLGDVPPTPTPPTPVPPTPEVLTGIAKIAFDNSATFPKEETAKVAGVFENVATQIAAGALKTAAEVNNATKEARIKALGDARANAWNTWAAPINAELTAQSKAGKLATMDQHKAVWGEIAKGLRRAAQ